MLKRLNIESLEICKSHSSVLDVYCSERAKRFLETGQSQPNYNLFDSLIQFIISKGKTTNPTLFTEHDLLERNLFYGVDRGDLPDKVLLNTLISVLDDYSREDPEVKTAKENMRFASYPGMKGIDFQLELPPTKALDLTRRLRDYLPIELLKGVTAYARIPSVCPV